MKNKKNREKLVVTVETVESLLSFFRDHHIYVYVSYSYIN